MTKRRKGDQLDRQLRALGRLRKTREGRKIMEECRRGIFQCLIDGVGKP